MQHIKGLGKLLLSAYLMKRVNSRIARGSGGIVGKYAKLMLVGYLFKKLRAKNMAVSKSEIEAEPVEEVKSKEKTRGSSKMGFGKILLGALVGATIIYVAKKHVAKKHLHKIQVQ